MSQLQIDINLLSENVLGLTYDILCDVEAELEKHRQVPTHDELIEIITRVRSQNSHDLDLTNTILFFVLQHKIDDLSPTQQISKETHDLLMQTVISELHVRTLPPTYKSLIENLEKSERIMARIRVGNQSEAKQKSDQRRAERNQRLSTWVKRGDEDLYHDLDRYLEFIKAIAEGQPLTANNMDRFRRSLNDESNIPLPEETSIGDRVRRSSRRAAASIISEDIDDLPKISKEQRAQIHILHDLIDDFSIEKEGLQQVAQQITELQHKKIDRESRQISSVMSEYIQGNIDTKQTISSVYRAMKHPFSKVLDQERDRPLPVKIAKLGAVAVRKGGKLTKKIVKFYVKGTVGLARDAVVQPSSFILKSSLSAVNAMEAVKASVAAQLEEDPVKKAELAAEARAKLSNLTYNSRKSVEAIIMSCATSLVIGATAASGGASLPVTAGVSAAISHAFFAADVMDNTKSGIEFVQALNDLVTNSNNVEDPDLRESLQQIRILLEKIAIEEEELTADSVLRTISSSSFSSSPGSPGSHSLDSLDDGDDYGDVDDDLLDNDSSFGDIEQQTISSQQEFKQKFNQVLADIGDVSRQSSEQGMDRADDLDDDLTDKNQGSMRPK